MDETGTTPGIGEQQRKAAAGIDARVRALAQAGLDDSAIFAEMSATMPKFKWLMDTTPRGGLDALCAELPGFSRYARILEGVARGTASSAIRVPR